MLLKNPVLILAAACISSAVAAPQIYGRYGSSLSILFDHGKTNSIVSSSVDSDMVTRNSLPESHPPVAAPLFIASDKSNIDKFVLEDAQEYQNPEPGKQGFSTSNGSSSTADEGTNDNHDNGGFSANKRSTDSGDTNDNNGSSASEGSTDNNSSNENNGNSTSGVSSDPKDASTG